MSHVIALRMRLYGRVQGVGFRYSTWRQALQLELTGYVCNLYDGSVEVVVSGEPSQVQQLQSWLQAGGPSVARVERYLSEPYPADVAFTDFRIRY